MSDSDLAPYATGRTSILVHKGKGILVKRCANRDEAIVEAISEFGITSRPEQVYLTSFVGAQGQEVEISRSAFTFIRDTIPIHVHIREEDDTSERPRWPALPAGVEPTDMFRLAKPISQVQTIRRFNQAQNSGVGGSRTSESRLDSISDWQRKSAVTPDTADSLHNPPGPPMAMVQSPDEMLTDTAMNSLINGYMKNGSSFPTNLTQSQTSTPPSGNAGRAWNWFKRAGTAMKAGPPEPDVPLDESAKPWAHTGPKVSNELSTTHSGLKQVNDSGHLPTRPSKDDRQSHKHVPSTLQQDKRQSAKVTEEIQDLLKSQESLQSQIMEETARLSINKPAVLDRGTHGPFDDPSEPWGPGGLVLDDGLSMSDLSSSQRLEPSDRQPWWARPVDAFDSRNRKKLGLKPLQLGVNDTDAHAKPFSPPRYSHRTAVNPSNVKVRGANQPPPDTPSSVSRPFGIQHSPDRKSARDGPLPRPSRADVDTRPLPLDIPESPFSSRRFTRHGERLENMETTNEVHIKRDKANREQSSKTREQLGKIRTAKKTSVSIAAAAAVRLPAKPSSRAREDSTTLFESTDATGRGQGHNTKAPRTKPVRQNTEAMRSAVPVAQESSIAVAQDPNVPPRDSPAKNMTESRSRQKHAAAAPVVPVASLPPQITPGPRKPGVSDGGAFAAAAMAARRQMTRDREDSNRADSFQPNASSKSLRSRQQQDQQISAPDHRKKSSLNSLKDFVAAPVRQRGEYLEPDDLAEAADEVGSLVSVGGTSTAERYTSSSRDSYAAQNMDTVYLARVVLGPIDLSSPNRKGSDLVLKARPEISQISFEWKQEAKVLLELPFEAISLLQIPEPGCSKAFIIIYPTTGQVKTILVELDEQNLLAFQRFVLVFIAGLGADIAYLSDATFDKLAESNGW